METIKFENLEIFAPFAVTVVDFLEKMLADYEHNDQTAYSSNAHRRAAIFQKLVALEIGQTFTAARILDQPAYKITCVVNPFRHGQSGPKKTGYTVEKVGE